MTNAAGVHSEPSSPSPFPGVDEYRQILLWPLALDVTGEDTVADLVAEQASEFMRQNADCPWRLVDDPLRHLAAELGEPASAKVRAEPYAEFVYFHDFVRQFLYPRPDEHTAGTTALQIFRRDDVRHVKIALSDRKSYVLRVDRCNLYLFRLGVAILAVEVTNEGTQTKLDLQDAMVLEDLFRRVYTPYFSWDEKGHSYRPGGIPRSVEWLDGAHKPISSARGETQPSDGPAVDPVETALSIVDQYREPPVFAHWADLLGLNLRGSASPKNVPVNVTWRHVVDERMPFMAYIRLAKGIKLPSIYRGDWTRICFADPPDENEQGTYFYDPQFIENFEKDHCYDRFFNSGTRHMFAGFSYVVVCENSGFALNTIRNHFRHMYFQMALIAHLEFATYLTFSSRLSSATIKKRDDIAQYRKRVFGIQEDFLEFVHLFRFTGISSQMQAQEMFDYWRKHLRLNDLLGDVKEELATASANHFAREANEQTNAANRLNVIAIFGVAAGLTFGFLGMNLIWDGKTIDGLMDAVLQGAADKWFSRFLLGLLITCATLVGSLLLTGRAAERLLSNRDDLTSPRDRIERAVRFTIRALWVIAVAGACSLIVLYAR